MKKINKGGVKVKSYEEMRKEALNVRRDVINMLYMAGSGHPGGSLSIVDILVYLYNKIYVDPLEPQKKTRDRIVLSKGHAAPALYGVLAEHGFFCKSEFKRLRKLGGKLQGHPDRNKTPGVDACTGSLGLGISTACGMALSGKVQELPYRVYALLGDGELQEGIVWEALTAAVHYQLNNLIVVIDCNGLQIDGEVKRVMNLGNLKERLRTIGFHVVEIDGHDFEQLDQAFTLVEERRPICILAKTIKGKGISYMENDPGWHGKMITEEYYEQAIKEMEGVESIW